MFPFRCVRSVGGGPPVGWLLVEGWTQYEARELTGVVRGTWLRGYVYDFIETFASPLTRPVVERALNQGRAVILADVLDGPDTPPATLVEAKRWGHSYSQITVPLMRALVEGGADLIIIETAQDILEVKAAIFGAREAFKVTGRTLPIQCSVSLLPQGGKMLLGTDVQSVLTTLGALDVDVIGLNCSTGPEDMRDAIRFLGEYSPLPVHCIPNAGIPHQGPDGETVFPEQPGPLAETLGEFVERYGVSIVGGCCGTTPAHIAAIKERCGALPVGARPEPRAPHVSSMIGATPLVQEPRPTMVGERVNSQGSRKAKELLFTARFVEADEGRAAGLFNEVVAPARLEPRTLELAELIWRWRNDLTVELAGRLARVSCTVVQRSTSRVTGTRSTSTSRPGP